MNKFPLRLSILFIFCFTIDSLYCFSQNNKIVPTSPEATSLSKMVNYPVSLNTGIPSISIPLYKIETGGMTLPIEISYHSGGFKIGERSTSVGLGWSLSTDIQITRSVNGLDDLMPFAGYKDNSKMKVFDDCSSCAYPLLSSTSGLYMGHDSYQIAAGEADGMPDKFNYKLLNKAGSFYFRKSSSGSSYSIVPVPYDDIKISYVNGNFVIIDTDGTTYTFGADSGPLDVTQLASKAIEASQSIRTGWKCTTIKNASKTETISFTYQQKIPSIFRGGTESVEYYNNDNACAVRNYIKGDQVNAGFPGTYEQLLDNYRFYNLSSPKYVVNTTFGKPVFHLPYLNSQNQVVDKTFVSQNAITPQTTVYGIALSRIDFSGGSVIFDGIDKINSIRIQDKADREVKTFSFMQSYASTSDMDFAKYANGPSFEGTLYLDSIQLKRNNTTYETYKLLYANKFCFGSHLRGKDTWGYPNYGTRVASVNNNNALIPKQTITQPFYVGNGIPCGNGSLINNVTFTFGDYMSNLQKTEDPVLTAGMLRRIVYPTGGFVDFDFESNMFRAGAGMGTLDFVGMSGGLRIRSINYYDGKSIKPVSQKFYRYGELEDGIGLIIGSPYKNFNPENRAFDVYSYTQTIAYLTGPSTANFGADFLPIPVECYSRSCLTATYREKKTTYLPTSSSDYSYSTGAPIYYTKVTEYNSDFGVATGKTVHRFYNHNQFDTYWYSELSKIPNTNIDVLKTDGLSGIQKSIEDYKLEKGKYSLVHSKEFKYTKYSQREQIRVVYSFFKTLYKLIGGNFNNNEYQLYNASDYLNGINDSYYDLFEAGQYGIQVAKILPSSEIEKWVEGTDTLSRTTNYSYDNPLYTQASKVETIGSKGEINTKTFKYAYDYPGVTVYDQMKANNMISQVIEEIQHNDTQEISRTKVNYGFVNNPAFITPVSELKSVNGQALDTTFNFDVYDVKGNILQIREKSKLVKSYLWAYHGKYPVAQIDGAAFAKVATLVDVNSLSSMTNETIIKDVVKKVRDSIPTAMVTTYTHHPLIGVSSEIDANGRSKSYEYDSYARLSVIKDNNSNVIKKYDYHVTGSTVPFAAALLEYSTPRMLSFNSTDFPDHNSRVLNYVSPGAEAYGANVIRASQSAEYMMNYHYPAIYKDASMPLASVDVKLEYGALYESEPMPRHVYFDLIKDDHVVFSQKFPIDINGAISFKIVEGTYTVSYRFDENYSGSLSRVYMYNTSGAYQPFKSGSTLNFISTVGYGFLLTNHRTQ